MSQHDFNIANQSFPATRTDINDAILAIVSNSSGDTEPSTTYANQWWYETDTNILKIRNEANDGWVDVITLDASMTASASELSQLDAITRGSILYGNASGETARLAKGGAGTVLTSDGTDISWAAAGGGGATEFIASLNASNSATLNFTGFDPSSFDYYRFVYINMLPGADGNHWQLRTSTNGGSSYDSAGGDYKYVQRGLRAISPTDSTSYLSSTFFSMTAGNGVSATASQGGCSGTVDFFGPGETNLTHIMSESINKSAFGGPNLFKIAGFRDSVAGVNAVQFYYSGSNIISGTINMYGFKNA